MRHAEVHEEPGKAVVAGTEAVSAGQVAQRAADEGLADTGRSGDQDVPVVADPLAGGKPGHDEVWANLSDVQVSRDLKYNVLYRWFCGIGWDDDVPDDTTLVVFRRRLGAEVFGRLFARVVEQAKEKGLLKGKWAVVDGTKVVAHAAVKSNVALAREGRKRLLRIVEKHDSDLARDLSPLGEPERDNDYPDHDAFLAAEVLKGQELISRLEGRQEKDLAEFRELPG